MGDEEMPGGLCPPKGANLIVEVPMSSNSWKTFRKYVRNGEGLYMTLAKLGLKDSDSDEVFLRHAYKANFGRELDLEHPKRYNEKLQWLKLHDRRPEYVTMVDKYEAKKYVAERIGEQYVVPAYGVWDSPGEIDFGALPDRFVLKCTHDCGGIVICRDRKEFDEGRARQLLGKWLKRQFFQEWREWPYRLVKPRILAEKFMEDAATGELADYKFFAFDGVVRAMFVAMDRQNPDEETKFDFYDADFRHLDLVNGHPNSRRPLPKPKSFDEMKSLAETLSKGIPHVRADFYEVDGRPYFGELTFSHWSGMVPFEPDEWDFTFGDWLRLPEANA